MGNSKEYQKQHINKAASNFLCEPLEGALGEKTELYDVYLQLKDEQEEGNGNEFASNYVDMPDSVSAFTSVDMLVDLIESSAALETQLPEVLVNVDWAQLKKQKQELLKAIEEAENKYGNPNPERADALNGILNLIDSIQDYAVDTCGLSEELVMLTEAKEGK
jgi:hypothetical protein